MKITHPLLFTAGTMVVLAYVLWVLLGNPRFSNGVPVASLIGLLGTCFTAASHFLEEDKKEEKKCD